MGSVHPVSLGWQEEPFWLTAPGEMKIADWRMYEHYLMPVHETHPPVFSSLL